MNIDYLHEVDILILVYKWFESGYHVCIYRYKLFEKIKIKI